VTGSAFVSFTVNVTTPLELDGPLAADTVEVPPPAVKVTFLPLTGWLNASRSVTVIVDVVTPSATTEAGLEVTVDAPALTGPAVKATVAVGDMVIVSVVSFAV